MAELKGNSSVVSAGSYIIMQDTLPPVPRIVREGAFGRRWSADEAISEFLATNDDFIIDRERERLLITNSPGGFLKRIK